MWAAGARRIRSAGLEQAGGCLSALTPGDGDAEMLQVHDGLEDERAVTAQHDWAFGQHGGGLKAARRRPLAPSTPGGGPAPGVRAFHSAAGGDEDLAAPA